MVKRIEEDAAQAVSDYTTRTDGWANLVVGLGVVGRDKREHTYFAHDRNLSRGNLDAINRADAIGARIIETPARDMLRAWFQINVSPVDDVQLPITPIEANTWASGVQDKLDDLKARRELGRALRWAGLYGGAVIVIGLDDGIEDLSEPVIPEKIRDIRWLKALTRYQVTPHEPIDDFDSEFFGQPDRYDILPFIRTGATTTVHASRLLRFDGVDLPPDANLQNRDSRWGDSVLVRAYNSLRDFHAGYDAAATLLYDFAQAVWGIPRLNDLISSGREDLVQSRVGIQDFVRGIMNAILIDPSLGETFERKATPVAGLPELLDRLGLKLSAASGMPMTLLLGIAPKGFANEDKSGQDNWDDIVAARQREELQPELERLIGYIFAAQQGPSDGRVPETWSLEFNPLTQTTANEQSQIRLAMANADAAYIDRDVVTADEVAASRFGSDGYSIETTLDVEKRREFEETEGEIEPEPPAPPPQQIVIAQPAAETPQEPADEAGDEEPSE
jgi:phage-related protein (TIGR01555 family)